MIIMSGQTQCPVLNKQEPTTYLNPLGFSREHGQGKPYFLRPIILTAESSVRA